MKPEGNMGADRRVPVASGMRTTLAAMVIGFGIAILVFRLTTFAIRRIDPMAFGDQRIRESLAKVGAVAASRDKPAVLLLGTSNVQWGFNPMLLAAELGNTVDVWNFAQAGLAATSWRLFNEHILNAFAEVGHKPLAVIVEFCPLQFTSINRGDPDQVDQMASLLGDLPMLMRAGPPERIARLLSYRYLLDSVPPAAVTSWLGNVWRKFEPDWWFGDRRSAGERDRAFTALLEQEAQADPSAKLRRYGWSREDYGFWDQCRYATAAACVRFFHGPDQAQVFVDSRAAYSACCDILGLHFDDAYLEEFLKVATLARESALHAVILVIPQNRWNLGRTPEVEARLTSVIEWVGRKTGLPVVDLSESATFSEDDFADITHTNTLTGAPKLAASVGNRLKEIIGGREGGRLEGTP